LLGEADNIGLLNNMDYAKVDLTPLIREIILNKLDPLLLPFGEKEDIQEDHNNHELNSQLWLDRTSWVWERRNRSSKSSRGIT